MLTKGKNSNCDKTHKFKLLKNKQQKKTQKNKESNCDKTKIDIKL